MFRNVARGLQAGVVVLLLIAPIVGQRSVAAKFDLTKRTTLKGIVTRVDWSNPHVHILMNVQDGAKPVSWAVELESVLELERSAWNRDSLKPGATITVQGPVARDDSHQIWGDSVVLASNGKRVLAMTPAAIAFFKPSVPTPAAGPTPRWPDGKPRLGPEPGETGYWARPSAMGLKEDGVNVEMDQYGLLKNINDAAKVAPFQPWARDLYMYRQRSSMKDDPMYLRCYPPGAVRQFQMPFGIQFLEDKAFNRIFVMNGGGNHDWHFIYTDGRAQKGDARGNSDNPLYYGQAAGKWDGDVLVVDSKSFNEGFWMSNGGTPHTGQLHLVERFTRSDMNTLKYEVTIDDPGAYTRSWKASWTLQWIAGEELPAYYCQDNRA
ncbi:MAG TPA: DUF6152 family protein [Terriglobia bacterium]|nr:DUF6152 family protein [Terriglobia bacterium]